MQGTNYPEYLTTRVPILLYAKLMKMSTKYKQCYSKQAVYKVVWRLQRFITYALYISRITQV